MTFVGEKDLSDYFDFLVPEGNERTFYSALCDLLADPKLDWKLLNLPSLREDSPTLEYLPALAEERGLKVEIEKDATTPVAQLPSTWDQYMAGLRKKDRHELRRKLRRLERADSPHHYVCVKAESLADGMEDFFRLLRASSEEKAEFLTPGRERFFIDIAEELFRRDQFKLYFLEVSGERVACCICFDYGESYLLYNSGYDPSYSRLSVGLLNKALSIQTAIEEGRRSFNFLKGNERYKYDLGAQDVAVYDLTARR
jgi:CelD/BcsL family acetyltransferase involved in cellulose biosynthesis